MLINRLLMIAIFVALLGIAAIAWHGFQAIQQQLFGIKIVVADFNSYMQGK